MALIEVDNISHSFGDKLLYKNASFNLNKGEHMGLVGKNGTGKTTLLNTIIGNIIPDKGEIRLQKNTKVGFLDQHAQVDENITVFSYLKAAFNFLYKLNDDLNLIYQHLQNNIDHSLINKAANLQNLLINKGFYEIESVILKVADGLGITSLGIDNLLSKLSGGQRTKVIFSKILLENPDVLLLDEPNNFLDEEHIKWLINYLNSYNGAFIIISHDYEFLDKITTCICDIEFSTIKKYSGNFSKYLEQKGFNREQYLREYSKQQKQIKTYEVYIAKNIARASTSKMAKSRQKALRKIERIPPPIAEAKPSFALCSLPIYQERALEVENLEIGYNYPLLHKLNFNMMSNEKVVITGFNGIGKTTLIKTLIRQIPALSGDFVFSPNIKIGYFEQDIIWDNDVVTPIQFIINKHPNFSESEVRKYLAQCGINTKNALQPIRTLSGGEQSKVKLCNLMLTPCNLLLLDEPTNHLDNPTKEVFQIELKKWTGCFLLVSHEHGFFSDLADRIIDISCL